MRPSYLVSRAEAPWSVSKGNPLTFVLSCSIRSWISVCSSCASVNARSSSIQLASSSDSSRIRASKGTSGRCPWKSSAEIHAFMYFVI